MLLNYIQSVTLAGEHVNILFSLNINLNSLKFNFLLNFPYIISVFFQCIAQIHFHHLKILISACAKRYLLSPSPCGNKSYGMTFIELYFCPQVVRIRSLCLYFRWWNTF